MPGFEPDDEAGGPPPHPLDRTWLHPSELAAALRPGSSTPPATSRRRGRDALLALAAGAVGAVTAVGLLGLFGAFDSDAPESRAATATPDSSTPVGAAAIAAQVQPGIAAVATVSAAGTRRGSAIAVDEHDLLTTGDVVDPAGVDQKIMVGTRSGSMSAATIRAVDPVTNLVVIHVEEIAFQPPARRDADSVQPGDAVVAVGRTSANAPWVSNGVVTDTSGWATDASGNAHAGLFATNAALAPDAVGGALVDDRGRVIGVLAASGADPARSLALPIDLAADTADQLLATGTASHGALGVEAQDSPTGPVVVTVTGGSSAAAAGLRADDRIRAIDDVSTADTSVLVYELRRRRAGTTVTMTVRRSGRTVRLRAQLDDAASVGPRTGGMQPLALDAGG